MLIIINPIYSTLFAVDQYSSKNIWQKRDRKEYVHCDKMQSTQANPIRG